MGESASLVVEMIDDTIVGDTSGHGFLRVLPQAE